YLPADERDITINPGAWMNLTLADQKAPPPEETGVLVVFKVDSEGDSLAGACFRLFDGNAPVTAQICDSADGTSDGTIRFIDVAVGTWTLRETVTPSNNYQWADPQDVQVRADRTTEVTIENELKPGRVQVNKINPEGQPLQGACFDLNGDGQGQQCTNTNGVAIFSGLEPGTYTLVETQAPQGFEPASEVTNIQVRPGATTIVNVVNQRTPPPPNTGSIQVQKFFCPAGEGGERTQFFGGAQGAQQLSRTAGCTRGNATFTLIEDDGGGGPGQFSTGADGQHQMTVPEGLYRLTETDPDLEGNSTVRVRISRGQMTTVIVINYIEPPEPEVVTIEAWKWTCTPSFNGTLWEDFAENCSQEQQLTNGTTIRIEGPATAKAVTGDDGQRGRTSFTDLQPGSYTIHEERPVSIPVGYLFCGLDPDQPDDWKAVNGSLTIRLEYGQTLTCQFFNIPPDLTPDTGTILVHKYVCEIETPAKGYNFEEECRLSDQSVSFSLAWFNGERQDFDDPVIATANPDGILWFNRLDPGTYRLREVDALWCHAESNSVNADGDVVVRANQLSEVWIYNCVPPDEPPNTGSGDAALNPPPATLPDGGDGPVALPGVALPMALGAAWLNDRRRHGREPDSVGDRAA
ncbi:MAG TPA: SpaA isopeptide-forming pilin-related protein, partial [Thermomicrobiales bacterium]|nr:SpaA isopeptide-forming pilin-related protein [Thermomicrobiales bacterium]